MHIFVDGSFMPGTKRSGAGFIAYADGHVHECSVPIPARTSYGAELRAVIEAIAYMGGVPGVIAVDNRGVQTKMARRYPRHTFVLHTGCTHAAMRRAHELAQLAACGYEDTYVRSGSLPTTLRLAAFEAAPSALPETGPSPKA